MTRWKVADQFRKRQAGFASNMVDRGQAAAPESRALSADDNTARTATVERVPDPQGLTLEAIWDSEWRENLVRTALDRVKRTVNPAHYEMYHLHVVQGLSARDTANSLGVSTPAVHLAKHRVGRLVKRELKRLEAQKR